MLTGPPPVAVTGPPRPGPGGTWWETADGSVLHVDPALLSSLGGPDVLVRRCRALRRLDLPGIWSIRDLVTAPDGLWLVTDAPAGPTLADLVARDALEPEAAARAVADVTATLQALAAARVRGTEPNLESVVLDESGRARLRDAAVRPVDGDGLAAWGAVAQTLAAPAPPRRAGATMLGRRGRATAGAAPAAAPAAAPGGQHPAADEIRFGPGVPAAAPNAVPVAALASTPPAAGGPDRRHLLTRVVSLVLIAALTAVLWWWLHRPEPLTVGRMSAGPAPAAVGCGGAAGLSVVVRTNGGGGGLAYRWVRSDGRRSDILTETLAAGQRDATLVLHWRVQGPGRFTGRAHVVLLRPGHAESPAVTFTYAC